MAEPANTMRGPGGSRLYVWPPPPAPLELKVPSVTTILGGGMPKPSLVHWAAKEAALYAVFEQRAWQHHCTGISEDNMRAVKQIAGAPFRKRDKKADVGTAAHEAIEIITRGGRGLDREEVLAGLPVEEVGYTYAALNFLDDFEPEIHAVETTIYSRMFGYAGTADLLATIRGETAIVDFKTSKDIYKDYGVQVAAYSRGDFYADGEAEVPLGRIDVGIVVCLKNDGTYKAVPFHNLDDLFEVFMGAQVVYQGLKYKMEKEMIA